MTNAKKTEKFEVGKKYFCRDVSYDGTIETMNIFLVIKVNKKSVVMKDSFNRIDKLSIFLENNVQCAFFGSDKISSRFREEIKK